MEMSLCADCGPNYLGAGILVAVAVAVFIGARRSNRRWFVAGPLYLFSGVLLVLAFRLL